MKTIVFPRFREDISTERRTVFHDLDGDLKVGELFGLSATHVPLPRVVAGTIVDVRTVSLLSLDASDLEKLGGVTEGDYLARWDTAHPEHLAKTNPDVFRVEFRYGFPEDEAAQ